MESDATPIKTPKPQPQAQSKPQAWPTLNWKELAHVVATLRPEVVGCFVDRIRIPARPEFPAGFLKSEWMIELNSGFALVISVRPYRTGLQWLENPKPSNAATFSPFELQLKKYLEGAKIVDLKCIHGERAVVLSFSAGTDTYDLHCVLIPSAADAALVFANKTGETLAHSRPVEWKLLKENPQAPDLAVRSELVSSLHTYTVAQSKALAEEGEIRFREEILSQLKPKIKTLEKQIRDAESQQQKSEQSHPYSQWAETLRAWVYQNPEASTTTHGFGFVLPSLETGEDFFIPAKTEIGSARQHMEKYFQLSKRESRRMSESVDRAARLNETLGELQKKLHIAEGGDAQAVHALHAALFKPGVAPLKHAEIGRRYESPEGLTVVVGRNRDENLEVTFKVARGNDMWLHTKGRPGAHVVILIPPKKSASLDTLLFAARLAVVHSGGKEWGRTEVDYTFRKHVKKIKGSTEVTYNGNKTLIVEAKDLIGAVLK